MGNSLIRQNPGVFQNTELLTTTTSIDSLSPQSPIFPAMLRAPRAPWVRYHNIIGVIPQSSWLSASDEPSDGVVGVQSAMMDDVVSEILVESKHQDIHAKPRAILEVRRILVEHLRELTQYPQMTAILDLPPHWKQSAIAAEPHVPWNIHQNTSQVVQASAFEPLPFPEKSKKKLIPIPILSR
jgi:hypothetical protein